MIVCYHSINQPPRTDMMTFKNTSQNFKGKEAYFILTDESLLTEQ